MLLLVASAVGSFLGHDASTAAGAAPVAWIRKYYGTDPVAVGSAVWYTPKNIYMVNGTAVFAVRHDVIMTTGQIGEVQAFSEWSETEAGCSPTGNGPLAWTKFVIGKWFSLPGSMAEGHYIDTPEYYHIRLGTYFYLISAIAPQSARLLACGGTDHIQWQIRWGTNRPDDWWRNNHTDIHNQFPHHVMYSKHGLHATSLDPRNDSHFSLWSNTYFPFPTCTSVLPCNYYWGFSCGFPVTNPDEEEPLQPTVQAFTYDPTPVATPPVFNPELPVASDLRGVCAGNVARTPCGCSMCNESTNKCISHAELPVPEPCPLPPHYEIRWRNLNEDGLDEEILPLKWYVENGPERAEFEDAAQEASDFYNQQLGGTILCKAAGSEYADITIIPDPLFVEALGQWLVDGTSEAYACAGANIRVATHGVMRINANSNSVVWRNSHELVPIASPPPHEVGRVFVIIHEFGHSLGLAHNGTHPSLVHQPAVSEWNVGAAGTPHNLAPGDGAAENEVFLVEPHLEGDDIDGINCVLNRQ